MTLPLFPQFLILQDIYTAPYEHAITAFCQMQFERFVITSTIHVLILGPVFFVLMKERALRRGTLRPETRE